MIGKKLLALLVDLTVSERRVLLNESKKSQDKRHEALIFLLTSKSNEKEKFISILDKIGVGLTDASLPESERNLKKRRFVDFAIKQIEEMKISAYLKNDMKLRNLVLTNVYDKKGTRDVMEGYLEQLGTISDQQKDLDLKNYYLSKSIELKPQSQTVKSVDSWRRLLSERLELIENRYKVDKADLFDLVSISYLDNGCDFQELIEAYEKSGGSGGLTKDLEALNEVSYKISDARINFRDTERAVESLNEADLLVEGIEENDREKFQLKRKIAYVKFLLAFHHGESSSNLIKLIDQVIGLDRILDKEDLKVLLYRSALSALSGEKHETLKELRGKVNEESQYMVDFVEALLLQSDGQLKAAKRLFHEVSYSGNPYVAS
ncbi:MAG: hypothetical protein JKY54_05405, partial [Flavobacteriales bacterium]|nr:hypothetical protein [Flavobacteriales bacterium]